MKSTGYFLILGALALFAFAPSLLFRQQSDSGKRDSVSELSKKTERPMLVENDAWWSSDFAAECAKMQCRVEGLKSCEDERNEKVIEAREAETEFEGRLLAAFQSDAMCSGITLRGFGSRKHRITNAETLLKAGEAAAVAEAQTKGYWFLIVNFVPGETMQSWSMNILPSATNDTSGKGNVSSIVHTVCSVVKGTGGSVVE